MKIYIVRLPLPSHEVKPASSLQRHDRALHANSLRKAITQDAVYSEFLQWAKDHEGQRLSKKDRLILGTEVIKLKDDDAKALKADFPGAQVIKDGPLNLIEPRGTSSTQKYPEEEDLWHFGAINYPYSWDNAASPSDALKERISVSEYTGEGVTIAVLDTGMDGSHPEIRGRVMRSYDFDVDAWEVLEIPSHEDTSGHGTHVAGLISGSRVGIAPNVRLLNGRMIPFGRGNISDFILALEWAAGTPEVQIINMSAGIRGFVPEIVPSVDDLLDLGVFPVIAIGNEGRDRSRSPGNFRSSLSIGATTQNNRVWAYSGSGSVIRESMKYGVPDAVAPGHEITSCVMGGGYESWSGTSMATPNATGIAALALEQYPDITPLELKEHLLDSCVKLNTDPVRQGAGLLQVM